MNIIPDLVGLLIRGGQVERFHMHPCIRRENVAEHSFYVAMLASHICAWDMDFDNDECHITVLSSLMHDLSEQITGDIPGPMKRQLPQDNAVEFLEKQFNEHIGHHQWEEGRAIVSLCDALAGMMFCLRERMLGNRGLDEVFGRYCGYATTLLLSAFEKRTMEHANDIYNQINDKWKELL